MDQTWVSLSSMEERIVSGGPKDDHWEQDTHGLSVVISILCLSFLESPGSDTGVTQQMMMMRKDKCDAILSLFWSFGIFSLGYGMIGMWPMTVCCTFEFISVLHLLLGAMRNLSSSTLAPCIRGRVNVSQRWPLKWLSDLIPNGNKEMFLPLCNPKNLLARWHADA